MNKRIIKTIIKFLVIVLGILIFAILVWSTEQSTRNEQHNIFANQQEQTRNISGYNFSNNVEKPKNIYSLDGSMLSYLPYWFRLAFSINIKAFKRYYWSKFLLNLKSQPLIQHKINNLDFSLKGMTSLCIGIIPTYSTLSLSKEGIRVNKIPSTSFILGGKETRMKALREYWTKRNGTKSFFEIAEFQLGFPNTPNYLVGTIGSNIKPVLDIFNNNSKVKNLCFTNQCQKIIADLGLIPDMILIYYPKSPKIIRGKFGIKSLVIVLELNSDGVLIRARIESTKDCKYTEAQLKRYLLRKFEYLKLDNRFINRSITQCKTDNILYITLSLASSEIKKQFSLLGFH
ncbi:MAG: hypothetical protein PF689_02725 [Deltaproteobacteria bacterium]|jgi:hypothetical protein|nr:hypothetical protein [Deltaproteobacteria bacterium]